MHDAPWRALVDELIAEGGIRRNGAWLHLPQHSLALSPDDTRLADTLLPLIEAGRFDPPWVRELATRVREPEERVRQVLRKLIREGRVHQVVRDLCYAQQSMRDLAGLVRKLADENGAVEAARYRDATGVGRKRSIQILEFFDRVGYTRRVRSGHVLRTGAVWPS